MAAIGEPKVRVAGTAAAERDRVPAPAPPALDPSAPPPPAHVAIIMDGNRRSASARGLPRVAGHRARGIRLDMCSCRHDCHAADQTCLISLSLSASDSSMRLM